MSQTTIIRDLNYTDFEYQGYYKSPQLLTAHKKMWASVTGQEFWYSSAGRRVKGFMFQPKNPGKYPVIIYNRGGSKEFGKLEFRQLFLIMARFAAWGFVVLGTQYSGNDGSEGRDELGGMDLDDVLNLKDTLPDLTASADLEDIHILGFSRGGLMTYLALTKVNWIRTAHIFSGTTDLIASYANRPELKDFRRDMYDVDSQEENRRRSPRFSVEKMNKNTKIYLHHGTKDNRVKVTQLYRILPELTKYNLYFEASIYPADHSLAPFTLDIYKKTKARILNSSNHF